jgi:peptide chain release factor 2
MQEPEVIRELEGLRRKLQEIKQVINLSQIESRIVNLELQAGDPDFWSDADQARRVSSELNHLKLKKSQYLGLHSKLDDLSLLIDFAAEDGSPESWKEVTDELQHASKEISDLEEQTLLSNQYDSRAALITIRAGAGGDDATDFAEMLLRMYLRYAEKQHFSSMVLDVSSSEGAGIKSAILEIDGPFAYGMLSIENGTHRLVRMSPYNAAGKRQTSFAAVEVVPVIETTDEVYISDSDIRVDVFRSSGPGGQSVNTTDSAVRITHLPTGLVVSCQNEKSQLQNKQAAMRVLQSRLLEIKRQREDEELKKISGEVKASWGEQMRSYVLAPYQMVKDHRTNYESNNPEAVFDGNLEGFVSAGIKWRATQRT